MQTNFFDLWAAPLPDAAELSRRFAEFNARYFDNSLPPANVRWSKRMRIAGSCDYRRHIITLSWAYHTHFPQDVDDTLKHEMIHLRHLNHDAAFRREAARLGTSVHCKDYPGLHPLAQYVYVCPTCRTQFHRAKRETLYCGRCGRGKVGPHAMLVLQSSSDHERAVRSLAASAPRRRMTAPRRRRSRRSPTTYDLL